MPLFKFSSTGTVIEVFSGDLIAELPQIYGEFERTGYYFEADLSPELPRVYAEFGFEIHLVAPMPSVSIRMQDIFVAALRAPMPVADSEFVSIHQFYGELVAPFPSVALSPAFHAVLQPTFARIGGTFEKEKSFTLDAVAPVPAISCSFVTEQVFAAAIAPSCPVISCSFGMAEGAFSSDITAVLPEIFATFSTESEYTYGTEADAVLQYSSSRRHI